MQGGGGGYLCVAGHLHIENKINAVQKGGGGCLCSGKDIHTLKKMANNQKTAGCVVPILSCY